MYSLIYDNGKDAMPRIPSHLSSAPDLEVRQFTDRELCDTERAGIMPGEQRGVQKGNGVPGTP
jgi:hypothetical protein